ncbi:MAG TPA: phosphoserine phosphatase SerB [Candidatus Angelobacter sp.]|nr:phosphoserine phosphatase SerB [Candidatus Angelobacter sp.]
MAEVLIISISGDTRPEISSSFTQILAEAGAVLLGIERSVIQNVLALAFIVRLSTAARVLELQQAIRRKARELATIAHIVEIPEDRLSQWVSRQRKQDFIVTWMAPRITAGQLAILTNVLGSMALTINSIARLSTLESAASELDPRICLEMRVSGEQVNAPELRRALLVFADSCGFDIAVQEDTIFRNHRRVAVFDMDSTLIQLEAIDELGRLAGVGEQVRAMTDDAMKSKMDFQTSFRKRLALLKGLPITSIVELGERLPITPGAHRLMRTLRALGIKTAILSGGFTYFACKLQQKLGFDYVFANDLDIEDGKLTGKPAGRIVDGERKAEFLQQIANQEGICMEQTIAVGDGANDLPMLSIAGLGVAFHAKRAVRERARISISTVTLDGLLYLLGLCDTHIENHVPDGPLPLDQRVLKAAPLSDEHLQNHGGLQAIGIGSTFPPK